VLNLLSKLPPFGSPGETEGDVVPDDERRVEGETDADADTVRDTVPQSVSDVVGE
jgi:hypothetical protein